MLYHLAPKSRLLWAKTGRNEESHLWESLPLHLSDTAEIARILWRVWLPDAERHFLCEELELDSLSVEMLIVWLAGIHDIGKATPCFISQVADRAEQVREAGLVCPIRCPRQSHAYLGQIIVRNWLIARGWQRAVAEGYACVVGGHHGANPNEKRLRDIESDSRTNCREVLGDEAWHEMQEELLVWAFENSGVISIEDVLVGRRLPSYVQVMLTGLIIMSDWIASNSELFPLIGMGDEWETSVVRSRKAWNELALPNRLDLAKSSHADFDELFRERFPDIPSISHIRPIQAKVCEVISSLDAPGLIVMEAPMGEGKTEASLLAAELLLRKFSCGGIAYLLPTQATSSAMFVRVERWLRHLLESDGGTTRQDIHLLHGRAALNEDFARLASWGKTGAGNEDTVIAHQWFGGRKRGLLAPFVVGTVDQLLMAALKTKHVHLRHLGLAGKVVVIDEVHAYDAYMNVYLDKVLSFLGAYGVPVLLLSATLPPKRRSQLVAAYQGKTSRARRRKKEIEQPCDAPEHAYPLLTVAQHEKLSNPTYLDCESSGRETKVTIECIPDDDETLIEELRTSLVDGGCICVLRNTVRRAQNTYHLLKKHLDVDVRLVHSRFVAHDRSHNDAELVRLLGPDAQDRPKSLVLVATQVVEQSLDIDLDLLITDVAPVDLLLQRIGRLHRHDRMRPSQLSKAKCLITGISDWTSGPPVIAAGIGSVYQPAVIWRTLHALGLRLGESVTVKIPRCIAPLVKRVYEELDELPAEWSGAYDKARITEEQEKTRKQLSASQWLLGRPPRTSLNGWMMDRVSLDQETYGFASVRDSEESIEIVLVQTSKDGYQVLPWVADVLQVQPQLGDGSIVPEDSSARAAALCTVSLPPILSMGQNASEVLDALERKRTMYGWQRSRWLAGVYMLSLDESGSAKLVCGSKTYDIRYSRESGLEVGEEKG